MENNISRTKSIPPEKYAEFRKNFENAKRIMTYYHCAMLETETKFKVLNYQFSLEQERNPIESIKTRLKSFDSITEKLLIANYWDPIYNCVFFACSIWNRGGNRFIVPFPYPPVARLQIMMWGNNEVCEMEYQPPENSYKQRGFGNGAYLENVCQKSLDA